MLMHLISKRWFQIFLLLILLFGAVYLKRLDPRPLRQMQNITFDYYNKLLPRVQGDQVVIIDLDESSLKKYGQWPWPHDVVATLIEKINDLGAKSIAFDMVFSEPDRTSLPRIAAGDQIRPRATQSKIRKHRQ